MRLADDKDRGAIVEALVRLKKYAAVYNWAGGVSFDKGSAAIFSEVAAGKVYIIDGYAVFIDTVQPWYSEQFYLEEWLTLKLYPGGSVSSIPPALVLIAQGLGCFGIVGGDSSPTNIMAAAYKTAEWQPLTQLFFKGAHNV